MATLNHIGIAVSDLSTMKKLFALLGLSSVGEELVPEQKVRTHFLPISNERSPAGPQIELLEPISPDGPVGQFIQKKGPGIHHLAFTVARGELEPLCQKLRAEGVRLVYDTPKIGAHGMRINFVHPASAGGVLVEIMEPAH